MNVIRLSNILLCLAGLGVSIYAFYVESVKKCHPDYEAMCDISEKISCSKVFTSKFGKGFGLLGLFVGEDSLFYQPNSVYGFVYFAIQILLGELKSTFAAKVQVAMNSIGFLSCIYLAYLLMFVLEDLCVVCVTSYVLIASLLVLSLVRVSRLKETARKDVRRRAAQKTKAN